MNKQGAILAMLAGKKVVHYHFTPEEWVTMNDKFQIVSEDGVKCDPEEFWKHRTDESYDKDWSLFEDL